MAAHWNISKQRHITITAATLHPIQVQVQIDDRWITLHTLFYVCTTCDRMSCKRDTELLEKKIRVQSEIAIKRMCVRAHGIAMESFYFIFFVAVSGALLQTFS